MGVLVMRALFFGGYIGAPCFWKLPYRQIIDMAWAKHSLFKYLDPLGSTAALRMNLALSSPA